MTIRAHNQFYNELCCTNVNTKKYVDAAREVAVEQSVACLDLFSIYMNEAGWQPGEPFPGSLDQPENEVIKSFLHDGSLPWFRILISLANQRDKGCISAQLHTVYSLAS